MQELKAVRPKCHAMTSLFSIVVSGKWHWYAQGCQLFQTDFSRALLRFGVSVSGSFCCKWTIEGDWGDRVIPQAFLDSVCVISRMDFGVACLRSGISIHSDL